MEIEPKLPPKSSDTADIFDSFLGSFSGLVFVRVPRASQVRKMNDFDSQNESQSTQNTDQETTGDTENATQATDA